jgi:hypothetical protein
MYAARDEAAGNVEAVPEWGDEQYDVSNGPGDAEGLEPGVTMPERTRPAAAMVAHDALLEEEEDVRPSSLGGEEPAAAAGEARGMAAAHSPTQAAGTKKRRGAAGGSGGTGEDHSGSKHGKRVQRPRG